MVFDGKVSKTRGIKCGVPQGSILGPLLFIISVNDICNVSLLLIKILFADNTCVLISGNHLNDLFVCLNTELISLNNRFRARNYVTKKCLKTLYYSYIYPYLIYCIEIWGISPQTHLTPLLLLQKKIVRIMTYSTFYTHTAPIFKELQILTIDKLVVHRIAIVMYKFNNGLLPAVLNTLYKKK